MVGRVFFDLPNILQCIYIPLTLFLIKGVSNFREFV